MQRTVGSLIRELRLSKQLSMNRLAKRAQISQSTISRWEAGKFQPSADELESVLTVLNASDSQRRQAFSLLNAPRAVERLTIPSQNNRLFGDRPPFTGDLLRAMRHRKGWTLEQASSRIAVHRSTLRRWEASETVPPVEKLHALCYALEAHPVEVITLTTGGLHLIEWTEDDALDSLIQQHGNIQESVWQGATSLMDLRFLSLEARFWRKAPSSRSARNWLARTYTTYGQWLAFQGRMREAENNAYKAMALVQKDFEPEPFWTWIVQIMANGASCLGKHPSLLQAIAILQDWLPVSAQWIEHESWCLRTIAEYLIKAGHYDEALRYSVQSFEAIQRFDSDVEMRHARHDHAYALLKAGYPKQAADMIPLDTGTLPLQQIQNAMLWAQIRLALGDKASAVDWAQRAWQVMEENDFRHVQPSVENLMIYVTNG